MNSSFENRMTIKDYLGKKGRKLPESLPAIIQLDKEQFPRPWSEKNWLNLESCPENYLLQVHFHQNQPAALSLWMLSPHEGLAHLLKILVDKPLRNGGIGKAVLESALKLLNDMSFRSQFLEVEVGNDAALAVYLQKGFMVIHQKKGYYSDGGDALIMKRCDSLS